MRATDHGYVNVMTLRRLSGWIFMIAGLVGGLDFATRALAWLARVNGLNDGMAGYRGWDTGWIFVTVLVPYVIAVGILLTAGRRQLKPDQTIGVPIFVALALVVAITGYAAFINHRASTRHSQSESWMDYHNEYYLKHPLKLYTRSGYYVSNPNDPFRAHANMLYFGTVAGLTLCGLALACSGRLGRPFDSSKANRA